MDYKYIILRVTQFSVLPMTYVQWSARTLVRLMLVSSYIHSHLSIIF